MPAYSYLADPETKMIGIQCFCCIRAVFSGCCELTEVACDSEWSGGNASPEPE